MSRVAALSAVLIMLAGSALAGTVQDENKAKVQKFFDQVVNGGDLAATGEYIAADFVEHDPFPGLGTDRASVQKFFAMMRDAFPDLKFDIHFMVAEGDKVTTYATVSGTQKKEFAGVPSSGKKFNVPCIDIIRITDGKAVEHWGVLDGMAMMEQLGAMPAPGAK